MLTTPPLSFGLSITFEKLFSLAPSALIAPHTYTEFPPGSPEERRRFESLQNRLVVQFRDIFPDPARDRCIVAVPSHSLDADMLQKIAGVNRYEERMLFLLMLLRLPRTRLIFVTSEPVDPLTIDYYLHLLPGIPTSHARSRLTLLSCHDASIRPLTQKVLERPMLLQRIRAAVGDPELAHLTVFNATSLELTLSVQLEIPLYACDPALTDLGSKSGSREIFSELGVQTPPGFEWLRDTEDIVEALSELRRLHPTTRKAVIKMNEGFSGEGNAVFAFEGAPSGSGLRDWVRRELPKRLLFEASDETWEAYTYKFQQMSGIVEAWIDGSTKRSPSVQYRIDPLGETSLISSHDQSLGGPSAQTYEGCTFPADPAYAHEIQQTTARVANALKDRGALGRFGVDFVSTLDESGHWNHYAIEINLRKGGTTHPFLMLQYLTDGYYDGDKVTYFSPAGQALYYRASDDIVLDGLHGMTPYDLIDIAVYRHLHFNAAKQQGVVFHLLGTLSQFGKLGVLCIAGSHAEANRLFDKTFQTLTEPNSSSA